MKGWNEAFPSHLFLNLVIWIIWEFDIDSLTLNLFVACGEKLL